MTTSKAKWALIAGLVFLFSEGFAFLSGVIGSPLNPIAYILGPVATDALLFAMFWVFIWASGALDLVRSKLNL